MKKLKKLPLKPAKRMKRGQEPVLNDAQLAFRFGLFLGEMYQIPSNSAMARDLMGLLDKPGVIQKLMSTAKSIAILAS